MTSDDPLRGTGVEVVSMSILLHDGEWQQLRDEASRYGVSLAAMVESHISAHLTRTAVPPHRGYPISTWPSSIRPSERE